MRHLPNIGSLVGGVGWRLLGTDTALVSPVLRFGAAAIEAVRQQAPKGYVEIAGIEFRVFEGEPPHKVLERLEWLTYMGPPVR